MWLQGETKSQLKTSEDMKNIEKSNVTRQRKQKPVRKNHLGCVQFPVSHKVVPRFGIAKLVNITPILLWFRGDISIVNGIISMVYR